MRNFIVILASILLFSCSESRMLLKGFRKHAAPLSYLHDSKKIDCERDQTLSFNTNMTSAFDTLTTAKKLKGKCLPLLVYNYVETNYQIKLGQDFVVQDYYDFFRESFSKESARTGEYSVVNNNSDYNLEISIDTCYTKAKYKSATTVIFLLFAYSMSTYEYGFPSQTSLNLKAKLTKGDNVIFTKNYNIDNVQPFIHNKVISIPQLRKNFVSNMVESLSLGTKRCIEEMIYDVNSVIKEQHHITEK